MKAVPRLWVAAGSAAALTALLAACGTEEPASSPSDTPVDATGSPSTESHAADGHDHSIASDPSDDVDDQFDLVATSIERDGDTYVFHAHVVEPGDTPSPEPHGELDGAPVWSYVWPTSLDSAQVGFESGRGILALAATSHPDFDDTPAYDENGDGDADNDGGVWHAHWVVLAENQACAGGLSVVDIPEGEEPTLPATWPGLPLLLDSPDLETWTSQEGAMVRVPVDVVGDAEFAFDGVTAGLRVSASPHDPLLCVEDVWDVASGDLSLPGVSPAS